MAELSIYGHSLVATGLDTTNYRTTNRYLSGTIAALLFGNYDTIRNDGVGGENSAAIAARASTVAASSADDVLIMPFLNDFSQDIPVETTKTNVREMIRTLKQAGKRVFICTPFRRPTVPDGAAPVRYVGKQAKPLEDWMLSWDSGFVDAVIDLRDYLSTKYPLPESAGDGTHPNTDKCVEIAKAIVNKMRVAGLPSHTQTSDAGLANRRFEGGAGTITTSPFITGAVATDWRFLSEAASGTEAVVCSVNEGHPRGVQRMEFSGVVGGAGESITFRNQAASFQLSSGETLNHAFHLTTEDLAGIVAVQSEMSLVPTGGGSTIRTSAYYRGGSDQDYYQIPANMSELLWAVPFTAAEDYDVTHWIQVYFRDNAAISGAIELSDLRAVKW